MYKYLSPPRAFLCVDKVGISVSIKYMAIRKTSFIVGEYYHIYNRGVDKRVVFNDDYDYKRFMMLLYLCNGTKSLTIRDILSKKLSLEEIFLFDMGEKIIDIVAYCAMPNHFHLLVKERINGGISMFMEKLATAYVMYFNTKNERSGSLFEGKFKAKNIDNNPYLNWVFSYIHTNPIKLFDYNWKENGIVDPEATKDFIKNYKYSSYCDYFVEKRAEDTILNKDIFLDNLEQLNDFVDLINKAREEVIPT